MTAQNLLSSDAGRDLLISLVKVMQLKLTWAQAIPFLMKEIVDAETGEVKEIRVPIPDYVPMGAAEMAAIIKLLSDNSVTLVNIRSGSFGETARRAEEEFPFPEPPVVDRHPTDGGWGRA